MLRIEISICENFKMRLVEGCGLKWYNTNMKRFFDVALILITLPLWLPLTAIVSVLVFFFLRRPIFFFQERIGKNNHPFTLIKFRTMSQGEGSDEERLTRFGSFLRASSLDELPQLFLVLFGKMSLVGPRPLPTRYLPRYNKEQIRRHEVSPGITGWSQVNGRNNITWEEKFKLDVWYVDNRSMVMDIKILFLTVLKIFKREGISAKGEATMSEFMGDEECSCM
jgi:lipopolysaccharide/colanic/teichoic acid biosynthesis glycosyltransferase